MFRHHVRYYPEANSHLTQFEGFTPLRDLLWDIPNMSAVDIQLVDADRRSNSASRRTGKRKARPLAGGLSECRTAKKYPVEASPFKLADNSAEVFKSQEELDEALEGLKSREEKLAELIDTYSPPHFLLVSIRVCTALTRSSANALVSATSICRDAKSRPPGVATGKGGGV